MSTSIRLNHRAVTEYIGIKHLDYLTDDFSIWQHTKGREIDQNMGYALDDGARGLVLALKLGDLEKAGIFLTFLEIACGGEIIVNFFGPDRKPLDRPWSEDALGEAYWGLSQCLAYSFETKRVSSLLQKIHPRVTEFRAIRSRSYVLLGAVLHDKTLTTDLLAALKQDYYTNATPEWPWMAPILTYANAIMPYALLASGGYKEQEAREIGLTMLDFLNHETKDAGVPSPIGSDGWYPKDGHKAQFIQQPIDPAYQALANLEAWKVTDNKDYLDEAHLYMEWFWGNNIRQKLMIDRDTEGILDGIREHDINPNQGAENIVCYLLAQAALSDLRR